MATSRTGTSKYRKARERLKAQGNPCHVCHRAIDYSLPADDDGAFHADHLTPVALGGTDALSNLRAAHKACNLNKGASKHSSMQNMRHIREW